MRTITLTESDITRFWSKVDKSGTCWVWRDYLPKHGYGLFGMKVDGKWQKVRAHRVSHTIANGPIPEGMDIDHRCHVKSCVNPNHLRAVTPKQNHENLKSHVSTSKSRVRGVYWSKARSKWETQVKHHGKNYSAGRHHSLADAEAAVTALRNKLFTHNDIDRTA